MTSRWGKILIVTIAILVVGLGLGAYIYDKVTYGALREELFGYDYSNQQSSIQDADKSPMSKEQADIIKNNTANYFKDLAGFKPERIGVQSGEIEDDAYVYKINLTFNDHQMETSDLLKNNPHVKNNQVRYKLYLDDLPDEKKAKSDAATITQYVYRLVYGLGFEEARSRFDHEEQFADYYLKDKGNTDPKILSSDIEVKTLNMTVPDARALIRDQTKITTPLKMATWLQNRPASSRFYVSVYYQINGYAEKDKTEQFIKDNVDLDKLTPHAKIQIASINNMNIHYIYENGDLKLDTKKNRSDKDAAYEVNH